MDFILSGDANWDSRIDISKRNFHSPIDYYQYFQRRNYGIDVSKIFIVLMCRETNLNFKQRIRFTKKDKVLFIDIMLNLDQFRIIEQKYRDSIIAYKLINEIPPIIKKYKFKDFNLLAFEKDLNKLFKKFIIIE